MPAIVETERLDQPPGRCDRFGQVRELGWIARQQQHRPDIRMRREAEESAIVNPRILSEKPVAKRRRDDERPLEIAPDPPGGRTGEPVDRQHEQLVAALKRNDQVVLAAGIHGRVTGVAEQTLTVEIARGVQVQVERTAVQSVQPAAAVETREKEREKS